MKKTYSFLMTALLVTTMVACKKDKDDEVNRLEKDLVSWWELAETTSMMPTKTYEPGNGNILKINPDDTYSYTKDGQVIEQGNYAIVADTSVEKETCLANVKDKYKYRFDVSNVTPAPNAVSVNKTFFYIADDKLYMVSGCFAIDGGSLRIYRRANPKPL